MMAKLAQIDVTKTLIISSAHHRLIQRDVIAGVPEAKEIVLEGQDAATFYAWVGSYWQREFERNMNHQCNDDVHGPMLATWMTLVTFREEICCRGLPKQDEVISALMERLRALTCEWRASGVDTVYFHASKLQGNAEPATVDTEH
ncbi:hypothetical protein V0M98_33765 (plasmid) [Pseudomonas silesiensis]|uniref:hypothetical protein n=1 Tax=Pseudomonas silesiensis TaxID=1853130 RepID=UPI0030CA96F6